MRKPPWPTCGWFYSSPWRTGLDTSYCAIGCPHQEITHLLRQSTDSLLRTSNPKHLIGGGCFTFRLPLPFSRKVQSDGYRLQLSPRRNFFCAMPTSRGDSNLCAVFY